MSLQAVPAAPRPRASDDERELLRRVAGPVARAARFLAEQRLTDLPVPDLEAIGVLAIWRKLPEFDAERATFDRWVFYVGFNAMRDASRSAAGETLLRTALWQGAHGRDALDDAPPQADFHRDTPETDLARLRVRARRKAASAWLHTQLTAPAASAPVEQAKLAAEALRVVHEEIARLSEEQRAHVQLRFWDEAEVKDVAARLGMSERTLRRRWIETRDLLEARLRARGMIGVPEGFGDAADAFALAGEAQA